MASLWREKYTVCMYVAGIKINNMLFEQQPAVLSEKFGIFPEKRKIVHQSIFKAMAATYIYAVKNEMICIRDFIVRRSFKLKSRAAHINFVY